MPQVGACHHRLQRPGRRPGRRRWQATASSRTCRCSWWAIRARNTLKESRCRGRHPDAGAAQGAARRARRHRRREQRAGGARGPRASAASVRLLVREQVAQLRRTSRFARFAAARVPQAATPRCRCGCASPAPTISAWKDISEFSLTLQTPNGQHHARCWRWSAWRSCAMPRPQIQRTNRQTTLDHAGQPGRQGHHARRAQGDGRGAGKRCNCRPGYRYSFDGGGFQRRRRGRRSR